MFRKVKFFLVCAMIAISASACSSDDSSTSSKKSGTGYRVSNEEYVVEVKSSKMVELQRVEIATIEGKDVKTFVNDDFSGRNDWVKDFKKSVKQKITVAVYADGPDEHATMSIRVFKSENLIKEITAKGEKLYGEVVF
ncbi:hypothetical protein [Myroides fluvii]|uniref:hypothetical protein n=1 Tax=Myroides fluvii TaxID=2572594 RepID=UPI00131C9024|nr:hypothetical protein [Myroides fluvii]